jgi:hypothetical protein
MGGKNQVFKESREGGIELLKAIDT